MQITVTGQQIDVGNSLRNHVEERINSSVAKYFDNAIDTQVVFSREGAKISTHVRVHVGKGMEWEGRASEMEIHVSFNAAVAHVEKQLRRFKRMKRDQHRHQQSGGEADSFADEG